MAGDQSPFPASLERRLFAKLLEHVRTTLVKPSLMPFPLSPDPPTPGSVDREELTSLNQFHCGQRLVQGSESGLPLWLHNVVPTGCFGFWVILQNARFSSGSVSILIMPRGQVGTRRESVQLSFASQLSSWALSLTPTARFLSFL